MTLSLHRSVFLLIFLCVPILLNVSLLRSQTFVSHRCAFAEAFAQQDIQQWGSVQQSLAHCPDSGGEACREQKLFGYYGAVAWYIRTDLDSAKLFADSIDLMLSNAPLAKLRDPKYEMVRVANSFFKAYLYPWLSPYFASIAYYNLSDTDSALLVSPYYWTEMGNSKYHVPNFLGRDYALSAEYYSNAVALFEQDPETLDCNWYYLNTLLWQARSFQKGKKVYLSLEVYRKLLDLNPRFDTVRSIIRLLEQDSTARF